MRLPWMRCSLHVALLLVASACRDAIEPPARPTSLQDRGQGAEVSADVALLPPLAASGVLASGADDRRSPTVIICELKAGECASTVAAFDRAAQDGGTGFRGGVRWLAADSLYQANWRVPESRGAYRISISSGTTPLARVDVNVQLPPRSAFNPGRTVPIRFRVGREAGLALPAAAQAVADAYAALPFSTDPRAAYEGLLRGAADLYSIYGYPEGRRLSQLAALQAFRGLDGAARFLAADSVLTGATFYLDESNTGAVEGGLSAQSRAAVSPVVTRASMQSLVAAPPTFMYDPRQKKSTLIYVNGILAPAENDGLLLLTSLLRDRLGWRFTGTTPFRVRIVYNPTPVDDPASLCAMFALQEATLLGIAASVAGAGCGIAGDVVEAGLQVYRNLGEPAVAAPPFVSTLIQVLQEEIVRDGRTVLFVPHSQGNLMVRQAMSPGINPRWSQFLPCVGAVGVAPPATSADYPRLRSGLLATGTSVRDILLAVGVASSDPRVTSDRAVRYDAEIAEMSANPLVPAPVVNTARLLADVDLHLFASYMDPTDRISGQIAARVAQMDSTVVRLCPGLAIRPQETSVRLGDSLWFRAEGVRREGRSPIQIPQWTVPTRILEAQPEVSSADSVLFVAIDTGRGRLIARRNLSLDTAFVRVVRRDSIAFRGVIDNAIPDEWTNQNAAWRGSRFIVTSDVWGYCAEHPNRDVRRGFLPYYSPMGGRVNVLWELADGTPMLRGSGVVGSPFGNSFFSVTIVFEPASAQGALLRSVAGSNLSGALSWAECDADAQPTQQMYLAVVESWPKVPSPYPWDLNYRNVVVLRSPPPASASR